MQQNEALFRGSGGMVLKPEYVHKGNAPEVGIIVQVSIPFPVLFPLCCVCSEITLFVKLVYSFVVILFRKFRQLVPILSVWLIYSVSSFPSFRDSCLGRLYVGSDMHR